MSHPLGDALPQAALLLPHLPGPGGDTSFIFTAPCSGASPFSAFLRAHKQGAIYCLVFQRVKSAEIKYILHNAQFKSGVCFDVTVKVKSSVGVKEK